MPFATATKTFACFTIEDHIDSIDSCLNFAVQKSNLFVVDHLKQIAGCFKVNTSVAIESGLVFAGSCMKVDINYLKLRIDLQKLFVLKESPFYIVVFHLLLGLGPSLSAALLSIGLAVIALFLQLAIKPVAFAQAEVMVVL